jgi:ribonuclease HII
MDEVGRGALAGPVTVGVVVVDAAARSAPSGVRDSKLLSPAAREALVPKLQRWAVGYAIGHAGPEEIDRYGIIAALRLAGRRALAQLATPPSCVLLDGSYDWLTMRAEQAGLFEFDVPGRCPAPVVELAVDPVVTTLVKADLRCAAVAAASVLAKVERDAIMVRLAADFPDYGWQENKGYCAPEHAAALRRLGSCSYHRRSWSLPAAEPRAAMGVGGGWLIAEDLDVEVCRVDVEVPVEGEDMAREPLVALVPAGRIRLGEDDLGCHADVAAPLRHDGSVAR